MGTFVWLFTYKYWNVASVKICNIIIQITYPCVSSHGASLHSDCEISCHKMNIYASNHLMWKYAKVSKVRLEHCVPVCHFSWVLREAGELYSFPQNLHLFSLGVLAIFVSNWVWSSKDPPQAAEDILFELHCIYQLSTLAMICKARIVSLVVFTSGDLIHFWFRMHSIQRLSWKQTKIHVLM